MKTALWHNERIENWHLSTIREIREWLDALSPAPSSVQEDGLWSCHALARVAHLRWSLGDHGWDVRDGHFGGNFQHSWLEYRQDRRRGLILDVYPVASDSGPLLVDGDRISSPWSRLYVEDLRVYERLREKIDSETQVLYATRAR